MAKIHFLNVDEGDCSIIQHDNGKVTMIDICWGQRIFLVGNLSFKRIA